MKLLILLLITQLFFLISPAYAEYVQGYYRSNGTHVGGYYRNSFPSQGNSYTNPYANPSRVNVNGYYRSNGTYVQPYQRTVPNNIRYDNLNYKGRYGY